MAPGSWQFSLLSGFNLANSETSINGFPLYLYQLEHTTEIHDATRFSMLSTGIREYHRECHRYQLHNKLSFTNANPKVVKNEMRRSDEEFGQDHNL